MSKQGTDRRKFLQTVALAGGASAASGQPAAKTRKRTIGGYPRVFSGASLARIAFPLGGVGAGSISLGGRGQLRDWEIFNRPDKGKSPDNAFACIWARSGSGKPVAMVAEARIAPPYEGSSGLGSANVPGLPRLESATFTGEYPLAHIDFVEPRLPVKVSLDAFSPFIPLDADSSGLPVAVLRYHVENHGRESAGVAIAFSIENPVGREGRANETRTGAGIDGIFMQNPFLPKTDPFSGSFALCVLDAAGGKLTSLRGWRGGTGWRVGPQMFWDDFSADGELGPEAAVRSTVGSLCLKRSIASGQSATFTFLLSWHFPNRTPERSGWDAPKGREKAVIGNHYCTRFADAWKAAEYAAANLPDLEKRTRLFARTIRETTLPATVREAAMANLSTLATPTCFRTADGVFHGFEGSNDQRGCCFGSCTHVWNYEAATAHVFPELSRSMREASFGFATNADGRMDFRHLLPYGEQNWGFAAADGQMGQIVKLYLDWSMLGDDTWLRAQWPSARRALEFAWVPGGWDANKDGVMEGVQHNTYDVEFYGPNPLCGVIYLAALRASEEMARALGDVAFADVCHGLFKSGSAWIDANLFNGEYYIQKVAPAARDKVAAGLIVGMGAADSVHPDFQLGEGCLVDQLLGQFYAHMAGLGPLLSEKNIDAALDSIYRYNYKRNLYQHESVQRVYALNDEAALVICDYGKGRRPEIPFPYFAEVMTGFEYAAAILMMYHGQEARGVELIGNIRRRYDGERRNPWNEAECGHHYARAMASWAAIPALSGFRYHAPQGALVVQPRGNVTNFRSFWSTGAAWGTFTHTAGKTFQLTVLYGTLKLSSVTVPWKKAVLKNELHLRVGDEYTLGA